MDKKSKIEKLAKSISVDTGHLRNVIYEWQREGLVNLNRPGRDYEVTLTKKGNLVGQKLAELYDILENFDKKKLDSVKKANEEARRAAIQKKEEEKQKQEAKTQEELDAEKAAAEVAAAANGGN